MPQGPIGTNVAVNPSGTEVPLKVDSTGALITANSGTGRQIFVNETTGNDTTGNGSASAPYATLTKALSVATANNNDTVYLQGTVHVAATVAWNKDGVNLVGLRAPSDNDRSRISQTGSAVFSPLVHVTGVGCSFVNLGTFHGFNDASTQVCWDENGGRNYYSNVQFLGMGNATAAAQAGSRSLTITAGGENLFEDCTIGLDTVTRATNANASLELKSGTPRNIFRRCTFQALCSDVSDVHVTVGADGMDRYALFDNCAFIECVESTGSTLSAAITANAAAGGLILLNNCVSVGATAIATTGPVYGVGVVPVAATSGIAIKLT